MSAAVPPAVPTYAHLASVELCDGRTRLPEAVVEAVLEVVVGAEPGNGDLRRRPRAETTMISSLSPAA